jgi:glycosyltransferase involved in cell wall biosynthesis
MARIVFVSHDGIAGEERVAAAACGNATTLLVNKCYAAGLQPWLRRLPRRVRFALLLWLLGARRLGHAALASLTHLAELAPELLGVFQKSQLGGLSLTEQELATWRAYLPGNWIVVQHRQSDLPAVPANTSMQLQQVRLAKKKRPFKVLYDLRWMEPGQAGGIEQASFELISAIGAIDRRNEYCLFAPRSACTDWDFASGFRVRRHYSDPMSLQTEVARAHLANQLAEGLGQPPVLTPELRTLAALTKLDFDMVHSVAGYTAPEWAGCAAVLTMNDLQHRHYPEFFTPEDVAHREHLYRTSAENARHIICISEFTRQDLHRQYGIALDKMSTIWIVPSRNVTLPMSERMRATLLQGMGIAAGAPYFFFPAHCWAHKNHALLVGAFARVAGELPTTTQLVLTGRPMPTDHPAAVLIRQHGLEKRVVHLGYRSPLEVRALFQGCMALVFPSLFEGFGMPVAEAMMLGKPVLCSNVTALPELVGNAAYLFDPLDVDQIAHGLLAVASSQELRRSLSVAATLRQPLFDAQRVARQTMAIYQRVHDDLYGG